MKKLLPHKVLDVGARLGEGPVWDDRTNTLYWIDIEGKALHNYNPASGTDALVSLPSRIGMLVLTESGRVLAALEDGLYFTDASGGLELFANNPETGAMPGNRFNDGKCDSRGRLWVGTMNMDDKLGLGALYRVEPDKSVTKMLENVSISNGLAWSSDDKYMYLADTSSGEFARFDFDAETGTISNRTVVIDYKGLRGGFDGLTIDENDNLWIAVWGGEKVLCYETCGFSLIAEIAMPVPRPSCCAFGGADLSTLYITTAVGKPSPIDDDVKRNYPDSGALFAAITGHKGLPTRRFAL